MSTRNLIKLILAVLTTGLFSTSCTSPKNLLFSNREWHINSGYGQMIDRDTTYRFTFGNIILPQSPVIISCKDSMDKYPGMNKFLADILSSSGLENCEILCYVPEMRKIYVKTDRIMSTGKPKSISCPMSDEKPYTLWVHDDDVEDWTREESEMYTYYYFNKRKKQLLIVDFFNYGDTPIAEIKIYQSDNKMTKKMEINSSVYLCFGHHDIRNPHKEIEFWSNQVEHRRVIAFSDYKIGQEQKTRAK